MTQTHPFKVYKLWIEFHTVDFISFKSIFVCFSCFVYYDGIALLSFLYLIHKQMLLLNSKSLVPRNAASLVPSRVVLLLPVLPGLLLSLGGLLSAQVVRAQHLGLWGAAQWSGGEAHYPCPHQARHGHPRP